MHKVRQGPANEGNVCSFQPSLPTKFAADNAACIRHAFQNILQARAARLRHADNLHPRQGHERRSSAKIQPCAPEVSKGTFLKLPLPF